MHIFNQFHWGWGAVIYATHQPAALHFKMTILKNRKEGGLVAMEIIPCT